MAIKGVIDGKGKVSPWHTKKYSPEQFIVPGQDHNGHSERMQFRCIPEMSRQADIIVAGKNFPFRTVGDMLRWGAKVSMDRLQELEPTPDALTTRIDAILDSLREEQFSLEFLGVFEVLARNVQRALQDRAVGEARRMVNVALLNVEKLAPGYWRDRYLHEIDSRFGHLLSGPKIVGAPLGYHDDRPLEEEEE